MEKLLQDPAGVMGSGPGVLGLRSWSAGAEVLEYWDLWSWSAGDSGPGVQGTLVLECWGLCSWSAGLVRQCQEALCI